MLARVVLYSLAWTPRGVAEKLGRGYGKVLDKAVPRLRRIARSNLEMAYPSMDAAERERIADGVFASVGRVLVSMARFPTIDESNVSSWIRYEGLEYFEQAKRRGKGVLFATGHLGNWELSAFSHGLMTEPMHVVVRRLDNPLIERLVARLRSLSGNRVIEKRDFARGILRALSNNEAVGVLIDQNSAPEEGVFVDFFDVPACAFTGFARIAARSGATVIPGFALWSEHEGRYILRFYKPIEMSGDAVSDTRRLQHKLEEIIRHYPDQWLWIHRRWKTRPPEQPGLY